MAIFKIYNDIQTEDEKIDAMFWGELEGVCYKDVNEFIKSINIDDNLIDLRLHCNGGSVTEGWAIYDALRNTGKEIEATIEGNCASMATVIYMAAPKDKRKCMPNAHICVHNPFAYISGTMTADELQKKADDIREEQDRLVNLYVERCGCEKEKIQALMDEDKYITAQEAYELGIVGEILAPLSASKNDITAKGKKDNNNQNPKTMAKENENVEVKASLWERIKAFFKADDEEGVTASLDKGNEAKSLKLATADDETEITIERESGNPQVGDVASPDGTWPMPDGSTITIADGVITSITEGSAGNKDDEPKDGKDEPAEDPKDAKISELTASVEKKDVEIKELKAKLEKAEAHARTKEDLIVLNAVKMAGGLSVLAKLQSDYHPEGRTPEGGKAEKNDGVITSSAILKALAKNKKK